MHLLWGRLMVGGVISGVRLSVRMVYVIIRGLRHAWNSCLMIWNSVQLHACSYRDKMHTIQPICINVYGTFSPDVTRGVDNKLVVAGARARFSREREWHAYNVCVETSSHSQMMRQVRVNVLLRAPWNGRQAAHTTANVIIIAHCFYTPATEQWVYLFACLLLNGQIGVARGGHTQRTHQTTTTTTPLARRTQSPTHTTNTVGGYSHECG